MKKKHFEKYKIIFNFNFTLMQQEFQKMYKQNIHL